jgi:hypothetical protein
MTNVQQTNIKYILVTTFVWQREECQILKYRVPWVWLTERIIPYMILAYSRNYLKHWQNRSGYCSVVSCCVVAVRDCDVSYDPDAFAFMASDSKKKHNSLTPNSRQYNFSTNHELQPRWHSLSSQNIRIISNTAVKELTSAFAQLLLVSLQPQSLC